MLRKSPTRTEAFMAANRRNALKCTGPSTPEGKARSSLNGLKNGRYVQNLPEKLEAAGLRSGRAFYEQVRSEIIATFKVEAPLELKQVDRVATMVWCLAWRAGFFGPKPQSPFFSSASSPLYFKQSPRRFRMKNHWLRIGLVYWVQRRRYWTMKRFYKDLDTGELSPVPTVGQAMESKLRKRAFRLGRPGFIERAQYGLDRDGSVDPDAAPDPAAERLHKKLFAGRWWEGRNADNAEPESEESSPGSVKK